MFQRHHFPITLIEGKRLKHLRLHGMCVITAACGGGGSISPTPHSNPLHQECRCCVEGEEAARKTREPAGEVYREAPSRPKSSPGPRYCTLGVPLQRSAESPGHHSFPDTPGMSGSDKRVRDIFQIIFSLRCASLRAGPTSLPETTRGQWSSLHHHLGKGWWSPKLGEK
ncbi:hypothetical protein CEXT_36191 [Caerostris extrusa]|uniref:Uncharacterized protein n=1 Tax=Caerostris extrusa TaxID=172846 RepID=A0AAV4MFP8_CAEEX|nr:hypothetical protein CEXT_36191 [Caerostris extrusa]